MKKKAQRAANGQLLPGCSPVSHWPKGKRRNEDAGKWSGTRLALANLIKNHWQPGRISKAALAGELGVDPKTVARWLDGTDRPSVTMQLAIAEWVAENKPSKTKTKTKT